MLAFENRLTFLLLTFGFIVADFAMTRATLDGVVLSALCNMMAPPSTRRSSLHVCYVLSVVEVVFMGLSLVVLALAQLASSSIGVSPSSIQVQIEHVLSLYIAPMLGS